jgi:hypothetical protein
MLQGVSAGLFVQGDLEGKDEGVDEGGNEPAAEAGLVAEGCCEGDWQMGRYAAGWH